MLTALKAWEKEERILLWAQPLQKVHVMAEQKPHGAVSHARHQAFFPQPATLREKSSPSSTKEDGEDEQSTLSPKANKQFWPGYILILLTTVLIAFPLTPSSKVLGKTFLEAGEKRQGEETQKP